MTLEKGSQQHHCCHGTENLGIMTQKYPYRNSVYIAHMAKNLAPNKGFQGRAIYQPHWKLNTKLSYRRETARQLPT